MTGYARVGNNLVVEQRKQLPRNYTLSDGTKISNFHNSEEDVIRNAGWFPVTDDDKPSFDSSTQKVVAKPFSEWQIRENDVLRTWKIEEKQFTPDVQGFLGAVRQQLGKNFVRTLNRDYADIAIGLRTGTKDGFMVAQEGLDDALENDDMTLQQYEEIINLADMYYVPLVDNYS